MPKVAFQAGAAFQFRYLHVEDDLFLFDHSCDLIPGEGLFRRFNRVGAFIEHEWYRFRLTSPFITRTQEFDFE